MNQYTELKKRHEKLINDFPVFYAFDNTQLEEGLKKLKTTKENIIGIGYGGFIRKDDKEAYSGMWAIMDKELEQSLKDEHFLFEAFRYELANHEFIITHDYEDTLRVFNMQYDKLTSKQKRILEAAKKDYLVAVEE